MNTRLFLLFASLTLQVLAFGTDLDWKEVGEITLTLPKASSLAAKGHFVRVTFLKDGTAVKRDFTTSTVFNGEIAKAIYEELAKAVAEEKAFTANPPAEVTGAAKEAAIVYGGEKRKFRFGVGNKAAFLEKIESAIDLIRWKKL